MRFQPWRLGLLIAPLLGVAACCASSTQRSTQDLYDRMSVSLAPDITAGRATLQPLPSGVGVTLVGGAVFTRGRSDLSEAGRDVMTSVIQALLEPRLLRIDVETSAAPGTLQAARVQSVAQYIRQANIGVPIQVSFPTQGGPQRTAPATPYDATVIVNVISS
jgi:hypothetical protein